MMTDEQEKRLDAALRALLKEFTPVEVVFTLGSVCDSIATDPQTSDEDATPFQVAAHALDRAEQAMGDYEEDDEDSDDEDSEEDPEDPHGT